MDKHSSINSVSPANSSLIYGDQSLYESKWKKRLSELRGIRKTIQQDEEYRKTVITAINNTIEDYVEPKLRSMYPESHLVLTSKRFDSTEGKIFFSYAVSKGKKYYPLSGEVYGDNEVKITHVDTLPFDSKAQVEEYRYKEEPVHTPTYPELHSVILVLDKLGYDLDEIVFFCNDIDEKEIEFELIISKDENKIRVDGILHLNQVFLVKM